MKIISSQLIENLLIITANSTEKVKQLRELNIDELNKKSAPNKWSILECIEHLNLYGDFYLPVIESAIRSQKVTRNSGIFKSGIIGDYFVNLVKIKPDGIKKMSTTKEMNPFGRRLTVTTIDRFLMQQAHLKSLLTQAEQVNMTKTKTPISLTKLIKLRLGDTLRFTVYHIERHVAQADNNRY
jgi:hypothetical protein